MDHCETCGEEIYCSIDGSYRDMSGNSICKDGGAVTSSDGAGGIKATHKHPKQGLPAKKKDRPDNKY